jgi:hypothetical protein
MAASDSLNTALFHGSAEAFTPGDIITPQSPTGMSYATPDIRDARRYAANAPVMRMRETDRWGRAQQGNKQGTLFGTVYRVSPIGATTTGDTTSEVSSAEGFRVEGVEGYVPGNFNWTPKVIGL